MPELISAVGGPLSLVAVSVFALLVLACVTPRWKIRFVFAWYDLWVGAYWDRKQRTLYLMLPVVGIALVLKEENR